MGQTNAVAGPSSSEQAKIQSFNKKTIDKTISELGYDPRNQESMKRYFGQFTPRPVLRGDNSKMDKRSFSQRFIDKATEFENISQAGQERKVRERKRTIFAGGNIGNNIFRRTLGGL